MKKIFGRMTKKNWMQVHTYLSLFFLPVAFIYVLTGVLYIFGMKQNTGAEIYELRLDSMPQKGEEREAIINALIENNIQIPRDTTLKIERGNAVIGDVKYSAALSKDKEGKPLVHVVNRGIYGVLVMMHKTKGTKMNIAGAKLSWFDLVAIGFSISIMLFYLSGLIVTSFCKKDRKNAIICFGIGLITTSLAIYFSI